MRYFMLLIVVFCFGCAGIQIPPPDQFFAERIRNCIEISGMAQNAICSADFVACESVGAWCARIENYAQFPTNAEMDDMVKTMKDMKAELLKMQAELMEKVKK